MSYRKLLYLLALCAALGGCSGGSYSTGDRVLVSKCEYDTGVKEPHRYDVVVFKFPERPVEKNTPKNYIKRLWGLPGEIIAIFLGNVYHRPAPPAEEAPLFDDVAQGESPSDLWQPRNTHSDEVKLHEMFRAGKAEGFDILRKPPAVMLALRRIVFDNDYQPRDLAGKIPPRWNAQTAPGWKTLAATDFEHAGAAGADVHWLRYQHLPRPDVIVGGAEVRPQLITDTMGYNSFKIRTGPNRGNEEPVDRTPTQHWVGDLMVECDLEVVDAKGEFYLEVSRGPFRYRARWDLTTGTCTLFKVDDRVKGKEQVQELGSQPTRVSGPGSYTLRLANFDARMTVWVNGTLPFGEGVAYPPPDIRGLGEGNLSEEKLKERRGPFADNDLKRPASIGCKGAHVRVQHLRLWRDTYYTTNTRDPDYRLQGADAWADPQAWEPIRAALLRTMYVQPGHYLCLGDNSEQSSDSREWGLVPARLMLGRALVVYYPFQRAGPIH